MRTLLSNITPDWRGQLVSASDEYDAARIGREVSIKSLVRGRPAHYSEERNGEKCSIIIYCFGNVYELRAA
jgi:hypothetical protein